LNKIPKLTANIRETVVRTLNDFNISDILDTIYEDNPEVINLLVCLCKETHDDGAPLDYGDIILAGVVVYLAIKNQMEINELEEML